MKKILLLVIILTVLLPFNLFSENEIIKPEEYGEDEFPLWSKKLRRGEIIAVGIFPIALLLTSLGFGYYKYAYHDFDSEYQPDFFGDSSAGRSTSDKHTILVSTGVFCVSFSLIDFLLGERRESLDKKNISNR